MPVASLAGPFAMPDGLDGKKLEMPKPSTAPMILCRPGPGRGARVRGAFSAHEMQALGVWSGGHAQRAVARRRAAEMWPVDDGLGRHQAEALMLIHQPTPLCCIDKSTSYFYNRTCVLIGQSPEATTLSSDTTRRRRVSAVDLSQLDGRDAHKRFRLGGRQGISPNPAEESKVRLCG